MPNRRPKMSFVLPVVTTLAVAAPLAALAMPEKVEYRNADSSELAAIPAQLAEVGLAQVPDVVLPLRELTGLALPDLHLSDLRQLPLPKSIPIPKGLPLPPGIQLPSSIPLPQFNQPQAGTPQAATPGQPGSTPGGSLAPQHQPGMQPDAPQALPGAQIPGAPQAQPGAQAPGAPIPGTPQAQPGAQGPGAPQNQPAAPVPAAPQAQPGALAPAAPGTQPGAQVPGAPQAQPSPQGPAAAQPGAQAPYTPQVPAAPQAQPGAQAPVAPQLPTPKLPAAAQLPAVPQLPAIPRLPVAAPIAAPSDASGVADAPAPAAPIADPVNAPGADPAAPAPAASAPAAPATSAADPAAPAVIPGADPNAPALTPGAVDPDLADKVGAEVKELTRDKPFSMVALTAKDLSDTSAMIRSRKSDGGWGPWYPASRVDTGRNDHVAMDKTGTEPIYVGLTKAVEVLVTHRAAGAVPPGVTPARSDDPALIGSPDLSAVLIDPGRSAVDAGLSTVAAPLPGGGPKVITREQWGADPSLLCDKPTYDDGVGGITVHHTAGRNDYTPAESAGIVRAIYAYHAKTLHWCDIGYNALVDKFGQIFEGRAGGLDKPVEGAHAGGFNENTSGVALMGDYESEPPSDAAIQAIGQFVGWRAKEAGLNPQGNTTMYSEGTQYSKFGQGEAVKLPIVFAHRDVGNTTCPGDAAYAMMDRIREIAAKTAGAVTTSPGTDARAAAPENSSGTSPNTGAVAPNSGTTPKSQRTQADIATLAALTTKLLGMVNTSGVAKYWAAQGGPNSRLGAAVSEPRPTPNGGQVAKFVNGYVYAAPDGAIIELAGHLLDRFVQLGGESGLLGLPLKNAYPVPDGMRSDFQHGSLIVNTATGIVTTLYKIYSATENPAAAPAPAAAEGAPIPAPAPPNPIKGP